MTFTLTLLIGTACVSFILAVVRELTKDYRRQRSKASKQIRFLENALKMADDTFSDLMDERERWEYAAKWDIIREGPSKGSIGWRGDKWVNAVLADYDKKNRRDDDD